MPEMTDPRYKEVHDNLLKASKLLVELSSLLVELAESLHSIDSSQMRLEP